ncbi:hypothetical protein NBRGN_103_00050 [Nocardia brasiliensis NBRC 14402]|uniref:DUF7373 family lipoprotein n=1 Tax=Nocardia brasiliensis TaxID=37326 RepID=UPI00045C4302|nr:hypothetical protein [Nocardia brasiliensis]ASF10032.1 hypothetical protein CEQ30_24680 [Nocardia brasiliensis]GAJ85936.1 hypothetical protein NBRGN_103_00050 [Nocardia brasiliensis NBRC 14402]SUB11557.1 Uncharacterised protein [Nocardia brasiliensis]
MNSMRAGRIAALACCAMTLLAACGSTVSGTAQPGEIDIRQLDVGNYPTVPLNAHDDDYRPTFYEMREVAAMRLADYVASAYDIDPRMKYGSLSWSISSGVMPDELGRPTDLEPIAKRHKMIYGFKSNGSDNNSSNFTSSWPTKRQPNSTTVSTIVMQFPDAERAKIAATEFYDADFGAYREQNQPVPLPKYAEAHAHWRPDSPFLRTTMAHGPYVIGFLVSTPAPVLNDLVALAEKAYSTQLALLDQLPVLSEEQLLQLPWDPDHLLSRALNPDKAKRPSFDDSYALLGGRGVLHYTRDRDYAKQRFADMRADRFALSAGTLVVHTAGPDAARKVVADRITPTLAGANADAPANLPDSACVENKTGVSGSKRFTCIVAYREYVGFVSANQLADAQQRAAAQYSLFANSR